MARGLTRDQFRAVVAVVLIVAVGTGLWLAWTRYEEDYVVTPPAEQPQGPPVTQIVSARLSGMRQLKVAELSGTVQATASDVRGFGWLRSDQVVKMPYSVEYFIDLSGMAASDLQWDENSRTLIVDAPDVTAGKPNTDEGARTLVQTKGAFVTRKAAEELTRRTSRAASGAAQKEATSPERLAQAREYARRAVAATMRAPLNAVGFGDARVVVTFPAERGRSREDWDRSKTPRQVTEAGVRS